MELDKEQKLAVETKKRNVLVAAAAGSGKALENGSIVYTTEGKRKIEELNIGELIYGEDGKLHSVTGIFPQGKKKKYIVKFTDKTEISCCDEHLWTFQTSSQRSKKSKNEVRKVCCRTFRLLFCQTLQVGWTWCKMDEIGGTDRRKSSHGSHHFYGNYELLSR